MWFALLPNTSEDLGLHGPHVFMGFLWALSQTPNCMLRSAVVSRLGPVKDVFPAIALYDEMVTTDTVNVQSRQATGWMVHNHKPNAQSICHMNDRSELFHNTPHDHHGTS